MQEAKKENKERNASNIYSVDALCYRLKDEKKKINSRQLEFQDCKGMSYGVLWKDPKTLNVKSSKYIEDIVRNRVFRTERETVRLFF